MYSVGWASPVSPTVISGGGAPRNVTRPSTRPVASGVGAAGMAAIGQKMVMVRIRTLTSRIRGVVRRLPMTMRKKILIALAIVIALPLLAIVALFATREPPDGPRVAADPGVVGVEAGGAYAWIVRTRRGAVLVDAGLDARGTAIIAELSSEGVQPDEVQAVLITHGHPDHYAAASLFRNARVLIGAGDVGMFRGDTTHYATFGKVMAAVMPLPPGPKVSAELHGGETLEFDGARFTVIATPGHSPGSVMY